MPPAERQEGLRAVLHWRFHGGDWRVCGKSVTQAAFAVRRICPVWCWHRKRLALTPWCARCWHQTRLVLTPRGWGVYTRRVEVFTPNDFSVNTKRSAPAEKAWWGQAFSRPEFATWCLSRQNSAILAIFHHLARGLSPHKPRGVCPHNRQVEAAAGDRNATEMWHFCDSSFCVIWCFQQIDGNFTTFQPWTISPWHSQLRTESVTR